MASEWKFHHTPDDTIITQVVSGAHITSSGFANGRTIPVIFVESDSENKIKELIHIHKGIQNGNCNSQWGMPLKRDRPFLQLSFTSPQKLNLMIYFDVVKFGLLVDQILYSKCMYLAIGEPNCSLSENLDQEKILLEIPDTGFGSEWEVLYPKMFCKHMKKKYRTSKKDALSHFEKMRSQFEEVKKLRLN